MNITEFKTKMKVRDTWFPKLKTGVVIKVTKTHVHIRYADRNRDAFFRGKDDVMIYDRPHLQFLVKVR